MCPECAFKKIEKFEPKVPHLELGIKGSKGIIYCRNNYTFGNQCLCKGCDGNCGPENGCPCPLCDAILGYNIYLKKSNMFCQKCKNLMMKTTILFLEKEKKGSSYTCSFCHETDKETSLIIYRCNKCKQNLCKYCIYFDNMHEDHEIIDYNIIINKKEISKKKEEVKNIIKFVEEIKYIVENILNKINVEIFKLKNKLDMFLNSFKIEKNLINCLLNFYNNNLLNLETIINIKNIINLNNYVLLLF
jgi:hypothetical protein